MFIPLALGVSSLGSMLLGLTFITMTESPDTYTPRSTKKHSNIPLLRLFEEVSEFRKILRKNLNINRSTVLL